MNRLRFDPMRELRTEQMGSFVSIFGYCRSSDSSIAGRMERKQVWATVADPDEPATGLATKDRLMINTANTVMRICRAMAADEGYRSAMYELGYPPVRCRVGTYANGCSGGRCRTPLTHSARAHSKYESKMQERRNNIAQIEKVAKNPGPQNHLNSFFKSQPVSDCVEWGKR